MHDPAPARRPDPVQGMTTMASKASRATWAKRAGLAGFLFFFIKGLAWIGVAAAASLGITAL